MVLPSPDAIESFYRHQQKPKKCFGAEDWKHRKGCSRSHPKCKWRRVMLYGGPCFCTSYHFPHRPDSGPCKYRNLTGDMPAILWNDPHFAEDREAIIAEYERQKAERRAARQTQARHSR